MVIPNGWWVDVLDISIVSFLFYKLFHLVRGTRAAQMLFGLIIIIAGSLVAELLRFDALNWLISSLRTVWVVAFVIIFQPELRRVLAQMGQSRFVRYFVRSQHLAVRDEVARAAGDLSHKKIGALIVIGRDASLRQYIETGTRINAKVTSELISTIFTPQTPLHDGACIIEREELVAAGCILPLSDNPVLPPSLGMRHRAAVGLTEEADAGVVVVSGESGGISVAVRGNLRKQLDTESLREVLEEVMTP